MKREDTKPCPRCGKRIARTDFVRLDGEPSTRAKYCRECQPVMAIRSRTRPFEFSDTVKNEVLGRQFGRCADCGTDIRETAEEFHHVVPNQAGNPAAPEDAFLRTAMNCVMLCVVCHPEAHTEDVTRGPDYREGAVKGPHSFVHSHGGDRNAHLAWARELSARTPSGWRGASVRMVLGDTCA